MLDPAELVSTARLLEREGRRQHFGDAMLRRAISTAYYALFHAVLRAAAERFVGDASSNAGAYSRLYRSFDHGHMKRACEELRLSELRDRTKDALRLDSICQDTRDFAGSFTSLQEARHIADYDPIRLFGQSDSASLIDTAETAIEAFRSIPVVEQTSILAFMMVRTRV